MEPESFCDTEQEKLVYLDLQLMKDITIDDVFVSTKKCPFSVCCPGNSTP